MKYLEFHVMFAVVLLVLL